MKNIFKKVLKFVSSRLIYLVIGIFLAVGATYVYATWDQARTGDSGLLTEANWNELVTMIENNIGGETERGTDSAALAADYTSARATKIDNLDATVSSRLATAAYTAERGTDSAALASNYTATRAGYLDSIPTILAAGGVTFRGYTASTYSGNMAGSGGMSTKCNSEYPGSHACTWDEILKLGVTFTYSKNAWIVDGAYYDGTNQITKDGATSDSSNTPLRFNCAGWYSSLATHKGPRSYQYVYRIELTPCDNVLVIPCCE